MDSRSLSAIVVAGTHSGVGKTSVTLGLLAALRRRGLVVQPFKVGPDFIDPLHHQQASGRVARNLDGWMLDADSNRRRFARATADADVAVIEGVMGLFDGSEGSSDRGSTAEMAKLLGLPVVLVIDAGAMARSAAALIHGFVSFDPKLRVCGVILNNVGGEGHARMIREAVGESGALDGLVPILGALPRVGDLVVPERHLGLHLPHEARLDYVDRLATLVEQQVDIDRLLAAGTIRRPSADAEPNGPTSPEGAAKGRTSPEQMGNGPAFSARRSSGPVRLAIARDEAFCFYYADNLELLARAGAELVELSPLRDKLPTGLAGLYIGGGYPELHAATLAANVAAREAIRELADAGAPIYAECGGLMYLAESLELDGITHPFCGVLPFTTRMPAPLTLSYVEVQTTGGLFGAGHTARGHLFHHSQISGNPDTERCYELTTSRGEHMREGYSRGGSVLASYAHLHFASAPGLAEAFVERCRRFAATSSAHPV